ncbi:bifunctional 4-hydroxy-2-oxoglutarate aldolase/2-dehydro-3-deoxy-phosphogluconate aldolase [Intestinibacillus sp. NTUH-41-i26]|uniref:bifunctional 4-hydroxy-2-oxoglutarate aldolase/2-dehydro-3-deoxy-phosphogluconate aldolase n=1 Tax=Butyricicoccaceae TaxID=3085642 RepID=UPI000D1F41C0|nr:MULTISPECIES: bifunctional 4-hydroxy-2-oxoglutarate aldolase/2-dehydro-3-deoxy-phosphogluconate aldolase [Butyricicoccaceae]WOC76579.1 bifunctional 4-hydroxy-2-oxoglutarate aldolase/2-dehydro-3-deoxy-phosphogluconate aldolase [Intestinibacillus sp. NTUH-41-i26]
MRKNIIQQVELHKLIAIVRGIPHDQCMPLAQALYDGGIRLLEIPFNQQEPDSFLQTARTISDLSNAFSGKLLIGAGTVVSTELVRLAADAGAQYIISPDTKESVIAETRERGLVSMPGAMTPTEITLAHQSGADFVKLFPAGALSVDYFKAVFAPLGHIKYLAVGGINTENIPAFLKAGCCGFGIGGNLVNKTWAAEGAFDRITAVAQDFCCAVRS